MERPAEDYIIQLQTYEQTLQRLCDKLTPREKVTLFLYLDDVNMTTQAQLLGVKKQTIDARMRHIRTKALNLFTKKVIK